MDGFFENRQYGFIGPAVPPSPPLPAVMQFFVKAFAMSVRVGSVRFSLVAAVFHRYLSISFKYSPLHETAIRWQ